jgi:hypothetical protein
VPIVKVPGEERLAFLCSEYYINEKIKKDQ